MRLACMMMTIALAACPSPGGEVAGGGGKTSRVVLREDSPIPLPATSPGGSGSGRIRGRIIMPARPGGAGATALRAVSRVTGKTYRPATFDAATGRFVFEKLPPDARYDICFSGPGGREIEGIDLDFVDSRLLRLAAERRKQLGLPAERRHSFSQRDVGELMRYVKEMNDFMDDRRVLYIRGHGRRATLLVELMRTRGFHAAKSRELVWRMELWYFVNEFGGWDRLANQERVLRRVRTGVERWRTISLEYYPQLSVRISPDGKSRVVEFRVPPVADASRGRAAGTPAKIKTPPHVLGLADAGSRAGSAVRVRKTATEQPMRRRKR